MTTVKLNLSSYGFSAENVTLRALIAHAYNINPMYVSGGPGWVGDTAFDVQAKMADEDLRQFASLPFNIRRGVLKTVLRERFGLVVKTDSKTVAVLTLTAPDGEKKLKRSREQASATNPIAPQGDTRYGLLKAQGQTMNGLAIQLSFVLQQRVVDNTGITGNFDIALRWKPGEDEVKFENVDNLPDVGASIYTALWEQLGLRLQRNQASSSKLIVVSAHQPTPN